MFFSAREEPIGYDVFSIGLQFSVGETLDSRTLCYEAFYNIKSMWISCGEGIVGSKIFVYKESGGYLRIIELTAYE
jgi:hypothetical protein